MSVTVVGISHRSAPLEVRERFAVPFEAADVVVQELVSAGCAEAVLLSTCHRTELYLCGDPDGVDAPTLGARSLCAHSGMGEREAGSYLYTQRGRSAVAHLLRVVSSLDSMVVGEAQIQGQVRAAYGRAVKLRDDTYTIGPVLTRLFETALRVGSRVREETNLGAGAASIPAAAIDLAERVLGSLEGRQAVLLGAGEMSALAAQCLTDRGVRGIVVTSRTETHAREIAARFGGAPVGFETLPDQLAEADLVVSATAAPHTVVKRAEVERARSRRGGRPLVIVDIALPRDVDPDVAALPDVYLFDLDDLSRVIDGTLERRRSEVELAERIIAEGLESFDAWYRARSVVPLIRALRGRAEDVRQRELRRARRLLRDLSDEEFEAIDRLTRQLFNKLLHPPTARLRDAASEGRAHEVAEIARYLFSLDDAREDNVNTNGERE